MDSPSWNPQVPARRVTCIDRRRSVSDGARLEQCSIERVGRLVLEPPSRSQRGRAVVARLAHNQEVVGSNPSPATQTIE